MAVSAITNHKAPVAALGSLVGVIALTIASLALAIILKNNAQFLGPINVLGKMTIYGVAGLYVAGLALIVASMVLCYATSRKPAVTASPIVPRHDEVKPANGPSTLHSAICTQNVPAVKQLMGGTDLNSNCHDGITFLDLALNQRFDANTLRKQKALEIVELFLGDASVKLNEGAYLTSACRELDVEVVTAMLRLPGIELEAIKYPNSSLYYNSPLVVLAKRTKEALTAQQEQALIEIVRMLREKGAKIDVVEYSKTPADWAAEKYKYLFQ